MTKTRLILCFFFLIYFGCESMFHLKMSRFGGSKVDIINVNKILKMNASAINKG